MGTWKSNREVRYALLGLVSQSPTGAHGYALKTGREQFFLGNFWQLNFGEIYRALDGLETDGLIEKVLAEGTNKKVYRITEKGQRSLDDFILLPPTDKPRPLRDELAVKLLFARPERTPELLTLIAHQREIYMEQLSSLGIQRRKLSKLPVDSFVLTLLIELAEQHARTDLAWLDEVARKLKARFGAK